MILPVRNRQGDLAFLPGIPVSSAGCLAMRASVTLGQTVTVRDSSLRTHFFTDGFNDDVLAHGSRVSQQIASVEPLKRETTALKAGAGHVGQRQFAEVAPRIEPEADVDVCGLARELFVDLRK